MQATIEQIKEYWEDGINCTVKIENGEVHKHNKATGWLFVGYVEDYKIIDGQMKH